MTWPFSHVLQPRITSCVFDDESAKRKKGDDDDCSFTVLTFSSVNSLIQTISYSNIEIK